MVHFLKNKKDELIAKLENEMEKQPKGNCICRNYVPTGIFQIDWKYYISNIYKKTILIVAHKTGQHNPKFLERKLKKIFYG